MRASRLAQKALDKILDEPRAAAAPEPARTSEPPPRPAVVAPLTPERYKIQVTVSGDTVAMLRRAQDLLRHAVPGGDPAVVIDRALTLLVEHLERRKLGATTAPRRSRAPEPGSRHIPAAVRRAVWARDEGRCAYVGPAGRCTERGFLEFHHEVPYAAGGEATIDAVSLRCRTHNQHEAELDFGGRASRFRVRTDDQPPRVREQPSAYGEELGPDRVGQRCGGLDGTASAVA